MTHSAWRMTQRVRALRTVLSAAPLYRGRILRGCAARRPHPGKPR